MSGGGGGTNTIEKAEVPGYVKPYAVDLMNLAGNVANTPYEAYGGKLVADLAPQQQQALAMTQARALNGNPAMNVAKHQATGTMMGNHLYRDTGQNPFMGDNPYLQAVLDRAGTDMADQYARGTAATTNAQFAKGGAFGGSAHQEMTEANNRAFADSLANMQSTARMGDYNQSRGLMENYLNRNEGAFQAERGRQLQAMGFAPTLAANDYNDIQALASVGDITRGYAQDVLNSDYQQWLQAQQYPQQQMQILGEGIKGATGGGYQRTTSGAGLSPSPIASSLGGASTGYAIGSMIPVATTAGTTTGGGAAGGAAAGSTYGGWGALAGGLLGYLGSR